MEILNAKIQESKNISPSNFLNGAKQNGLTLPIGNGNLIPVEIYKSIYDNFNAEGFKWLVIFQRYFTNLWTINGNRQEKAAFKHYLTTLYWFGSGAIYHDTTKNEFLAYGLTATKIDENLEILAGDIWVNNMSFMGQSPKFASKSVSKNIVFGKLNYNALPQIFMIYGLVNDLVKMFTSFKTNMVFNTKKLKFRQKNNSSVNIAEEIASVLDNTNPVIIEKSNIDGGPPRNVFEELKFPEVGTEIIEQVKLYLGIIQTYLGIYGTHANFKKERNLSNEFTGDEIMIQLQLKEMEAELESFIEKSNEEFGTSWVLESVYKDIAEEAQEEPEEDEGDENEGSDENEV